MSKIIRYYEGHIAARKPLAVRRSEIPTSDRQKGFGVCTMDRRKSIAESAC